MKIFVSGVSSIETTLAVRGFPVTYYPVDYPFFGINACAAGSGFRIASGLRALGEDVDFLTLIADDENGARVTDELCHAGLSSALVIKSLAATVESVALQEMPFGRRQVYCDLKDAQDARLDGDLYGDIISAADVCVLCNINYNRALLHKVRSLGKTIVTDVQNLSDINDDFNAEFIDNADILFLSADDVSDVPGEFLRALAARCKAGIIVMGLAEEGVLCYERSADFTHRLPAVNVGNVITAGAGAALLSGFVHYYRRYGVVDALKRAEAFAALKLTLNTNGGGYPTDEQVEYKVNCTQF